MTGNYLGSDIVGEFVREGFDCGGKKEGSFEMEALFIPPRPGFRSWQ